MEWGELRVLYAQKRREALAATRSARAIKTSRAELVRDGPAVVEHPDLIEALRRSG